MMTHTHCIANDDDGTAPYIEAAAVAHRFADPQRDGDEVHQQGGPQAEWYGHRHLVEYQIDDLLVAKKTLTEIEAQRAAEAHAVQMQEIQLQMQAQHIQARDNDPNRVNERRNGPNPNIGGNNPVFNDSIRPQPFDDGDDLPSYLVRFERIAELSNWPPETWVIKLGSLLKGKALNFYVGFPPEITREYQLLKTNLLMAFKCTDGEYRRKFRNARLGPNETYVQFVMNLGRTLDYWLDSMSVPKYDDAVQDFMIAYQFLSSVPPEVRVFIKERSVHTSSDMAKAADLYANAHNTYPKDKSSSPRKQKPKTNNFQYKSDIYLSNTSHLVCLMADQVYAW